MKKLLFLLAFCMLFSINQAKAGSLYIDTITPLIATGMATDDVRNLKCGKAQITHNWLMSTGHAGIQNACRRSGITKIHHVDIKRRAFLGIGVTTVFVYGE